MQKRLSAILTELNEELRSMDIKGEICLYGGAVMAIAYNARPDTDDVDAVFEPVRHVRRAARLVAERNGLPIGWLNNAVEIFLAQHERRILPFQQRDQRMDALVAASVESLCDELGLEPPPWLEQIPECEEPWFVSGLERLKAITIVQSPLRFRMRKSFVLENFLSRV